MNSQHTSSGHSENAFLSTALPILFLKTATPIILVMAANGLFTLVDAYYLGEFVGPDALTAVTLMFPIYMLIVATSSLVSSGYSSVYARLIGGQRNSANAEIDADSQAKSAANAIVGALALSLCVSFVFIAIFIVFGEALMLQLANNSGLLADFGYRYISILIFFSPIAFSLAIFIDTLRCEGQMAAMMVVTVVSTLLNFVFNYLFIVQFEWGVAGSAYGTTAAQVCALAVAILLRKRNTSKSRIQFSEFKNTRRHWREFIALGVPSSLAYVGLSITAVTILYSLQIWSADTYAITAGAYGIITRIMTFTFLPLLGLGMALQTIVGNNYGAAEFQRSTSAFKIAIMVATIYCLFTQIGLYVFKDALGSIFVDDVEISLEIARILPINTLLLFLFGPIMIVSTYFQAIGKAAKAAVLGLSRTYLFVIPLILALPYFFGEIGIWYAGPTAELLMLALTVAVLLSAKRTSGSFLHATSSK